MCCYITLSRLSECTHTTKIVWMYSSTLPRLSECTHTTQIVWMYSHYPDCLNVLTLTRLSECTHNTQIVCMYSHLPDCMYPHYPDGLAVPSLPGLSGCTHTTQIVWLYPHYPPHEQLVLRPLTFSLAVRSNGRRLSPPQKVTALIDHTSCFAASLPLIVNDGPVELCHLHDWDFFSFFSFFPLWNMDNR